jgi:chorismate mutase
MDEISKVAGVRDMDTDILQEHRARIDELDEQLICLLAERFEITKAVGELKAKSGLPAADPQREKDQIAQLHETARREGMDPIFGEKVFRLIVDEVIRHHLQTADSHGEIEN